MYAADIMSRQVITVTPATTLKEAVTLMLEHGISGLPVLNRQDLVGIVTEGDLLRRGELATERHHSRLAQLFGSHEQQAQEYARAHGQHVAEVMTLDPICVRPDIPLQELVTLLETRRIRRVPVVSQGRLVGIVSRADVLRAMLGMLPRSFRPRDDAEIARDLQRQIDRQPWAPQAAIQFAVRDGIVEFTGTVLHEAERTALRVLAANTAGVRRVADNMFWVDPIMGAVIDVAPVVVDSTTAPVRGNE